MHYLLFYEVTDDYVAQRAKFRDEHLRKAWTASNRGELILAGALANPSDGAVLLFRGDSPEVAENFAKSDPYVTNGLVKRWHVREWTTVVGPDAATPIGKSKGQPAILRMWTATATSEQAPAYIHHAVNKVFPDLNKIEGHRGACLLRRVIGSTIELVVLTLWQSMDAVRRFAGPQPDKAVVEPEAKAVLSSFDESVSHFEVVHITGRTGHS